MIYQMLIFGTVSRILACYVQQISKETFYMNLALVNEVHFYCINNQTEVANLSAIIVDAKIKLLQT